MIDLLMRLISGEPSAAHDVDGRIAFAALLVEAARADGVYEPGEQAQIRAILGSRYGLDRAAAARLCAEGEAAQAAAVDLVRFTRAVKADVVYEQRLGVIEALWEVIYADGTREMNESALMRKLCGLLHVEDRDCGLARQRVTARLGIE